MEEGEDVAPDSCDEPSPFSVGVVDDGRWVVQDRIADAAPGMVRSIVGGEGPDLQTVLWDVDRTRSTYTFTFGRYDHGDEALRDLGMKRVEGRSSFQWCGIDQPLLAQSRETAGSEYSRVVAMTQPTGDGLRDLKLEGLGSNPSVVCVAGELRPAR